MCMCLCFVGCSNEFDSTDHDTIHERKEVLLLEQQDRDCLPVRSATSCHRLARMPVAGSGWSVLYMQGSS